MEENHTLARIFNFGQYRRAIVGASHKANYFNPSNACGVNARDRMAMLAVKDAVNYLDHTEGQVAILDGTNSTIERRALLRRAIPTRFSVLWLEIVCTDRQRIERNILTKTTSGDYTDVPQQEMVRDFKARLAQYEKQYVPLTTTDGSFVKIINCGETVQQHQVAGVLPSEVAAFVSQLRPTH